MLSVLYIEYIDSKRNEMMIEYCNINEPWKHYEHDKSQPKKTLYLLFYLYEIYRKGAYVETERKLVVA